MPKLSKLAYLAAVLALMFGASWIAGQCRDWRKPKPPETIPGRLDTGAPAAGPVATAPTAPASASVGCLDPTIPVLSRSELEAQAAKYGLKLTKKTADAIKGDLRADLTADQGGEVVPAAPAGSSATAPAAAPGPALLAEETFGPGPAGDTATVSAWYMGPGERIDLRAAWNPYTPPVPEKLERYFGNVAKWERGFLVGYAATRAGEVSEADLAVGGFMRYRGWRIGRATVDAGGLGIVTARGSGSILFGVGASF